MNDISTAEVDSGMCWVSKDQKFLTKNEYQLVAVYVTHMLHLSTLRQQDVEINGP